MTNPNQWHDTVRDRIAQEYFNLPPLRCRFCKLETPIATEKVAYVVTEHRHGQFRADVAALTQQGEVVGVVEVINTNPPNEQTLTSQSELASVFYVTLDALDDGFAGYCSPFCWRNRNEENVSPWSVPACSDCERPYHTMEYQYRLVDWENPGEEVCIECAAKTSGGQWRSPGELVMGDPEDRIPGTDADVLDLFISFSDAEFWAMVWTNRTATPGEARTPETETAVRLDQVEAAFNSGDWSGGEALLQPIGAPAWDRPPGSTLFAWDHNNCVRTALAWRLLREYRLSCLPLSVREAIQTRQPLAEIATEIAPTEVVHRGFPDGRFTACGIDREKTDEPVVATMQGQPTCASCRES